MGPSLQAHELDAWCHARGLSPACRAQLRAVFEERDAAVAWQLAVADATGYVNRAEGQGGYEVADADTIVAAYVGRAGDASGYKDVLGVLSEAGFDHDEDAVESTRQLLASVDNLRAEVEALRGLKPSLPPFPPDGRGLLRFGLRWNGPKEPLAVPMPDGYWTPWHLASAEVERLTRERDEARASWSAEIDEDRRVQKHIERARLAAEASNRALREALSGLLREEWMTYEGNLEASGHASVDDLNAARAALAQPADDSALRALVTRAVEAGEENTSGPGMKTRDTSTVVDDVLGKAGE